MNHNRIEHVNRVFLATVLTFIFGSYLLLYIKQGFHVTIPAFVQLLYSQVILVLPAVIYLVIKKIKPLEFIRFKKVNLVTIVLLVLFGFFIRPFMSLLSAISMLWVENKIADTATQLTTEVNFLWAMTIIAIIPSILEEFVYRGVFYNEYRKVNTGKAVLLSGLLFGLMHMNVNQFIYAFFMGVIFALIIEATDTILASVIVHFTINGSSLFFLKITPWLQEKAGNAGNTALLDSAATTKEEILKLLPSLIMPAIVTLGISVILYYSIATYNRRTESVKQIFRKEMNGEKKNQLLTIPVVVGMGICLFSMISNVVS